MPQVVDRVETAEGKVVAHYPPKLRHRVQASARTLERRILELGRHLGARTRFQAGWQAAVKTLAADAAHEKP